MNPAFAIDPACPLHRDGWTYDPPMEGESAPAAKPEKRERTCDRCGRPSAMRLDARTCHRCIAKASRASRVAA